jgi:hypothetical protein
MEKLGISHRLTLRDSPQRNGIVEQINLTVMNKVRSILESLQLPTRLWAEITATVVTLHNSTPHCSINNEIPYKKLFNNRTKIQQPIITGTLIIT